ncbi:hypothetical protein [Sulfuriflexus sp.]|uniref:hypothetical protein n=1 Tax=Sulfuriflexus sp. TaxID=2015443 RepID=UPI0028CF576C|nr:hypothetical protein [Sulfuriflexus sp.]MDT8405189.1 hypothetical protein [Sulfuriflexus sp.]
MPQETNALEGILDIVLPLAPADSGLGGYTGLALAGLLTGTLIAIGYRWWSRPRQRCQRQLTRLRQQYDHGRIDTRKAVFNLAAILRTRLRSHQLADNVPLPTHLQPYQSRWQAFINDLDSARYSAVNLNAPAFNRLAIETRFWIRKW